MSQATATKLESSINRNNVTSINRNTVHNHVINFLSELSLKTQKEYFRNIEEFFMFMHGKEIKNLTKVEVEKAKEDGKYVEMLNDHIITYKNHLLNKNEPVTVKAKIAAIRSLYVYFEGNGYKVKHLIFKVKFAEINLNSYKGLSVEHAKEMAVLALHEQHDSKELNGVILLAMQTSIRISALLSLKWTDIYPDPNSDLYVVKLIDKRKKVVIRGFKKELFEKMIDFKSNSILVFPNLKVDKVNKSVKRIALKMGIPADVRIVTHSLRHVAINFELRDTGDIHRAMKQSGHKKAQTIIDHYTEMCAEMELPQLAGIRMMEEMNEKVFDLVDKNELLAILKETNLHAYKQICLKIQGIVGV